MYFKTFGTWGKWHSICSPDGVPPRVIPEIDTAKP